MLTLCVFGFLWMFYSGHVKILNRESRKSANIKCLDFKINLQGFRQAVIAAGKGTLEDFENLIQLNHGT